MKTIISFLFTFFILHSYSQEQTLKVLRHFMQAGPSRVNETQYGNNPKAGHFANAGDAKIYYEVYGKGEPFVILHGGILGSTYDMAQFIDSLSKRYQVIAVSTRGHGKSEIGSVPVTYEQKANDVLAVIKAVTSDNDSVLILGFSDGAYTGYKLAAMYPERVKKLIAIGAGDLHPGPRSYHFSQKEAISLDSLYWKQQMALIPEPQKIDRYLANLSDFYSHLTVSKELFNMIKCPVLVMAGERDLNAPLPTVVNAYNMIPNSQLSIIPNAGHVVFFENFAAVWTSIAPFIK
jgi:pimeloyl-ACP methyl ester carboxylesterase